MTEPNTTPLVLPTRLISWTRGTLATLFAIFVTWLLFEIRAWDWGFAWGAALMALLVMPFVWALWPTITWRRNAPVFFAAGCVLLVIAMIFGRTSTVTISLDTPPDESVARTFFPWFGLFLGVSASLLTLALMKPGRQQLAYLASVLLVVLLAETPFQLEELSFEHEKTELVALIEAHQAQYATLPSEEELDRAWTASGLDRTRRLRYRTYDESEFILSAARGLSPHCGVVYSSTDGWSGHD